LFYFSSSMTYFFNFATEVHFFSNTSLITEPVDELLPGPPSTEIPDSSAKIYADYKSLFLTRYSWMAIFSSSFYLDVRPTILYSLHLIYYSFTIFFYIILSC
jgi:hypothetical protein